MQALRFLVVLALVRRNIAATPSELLSCSAEAASVFADPCSVATPGGLFLFRQRFEPDTDGDAGLWGIDGIEVLHCDSIFGSELTATSPTYSHEQIGSLCLRSPLFHGEVGFVRAEKEWTDSEVGEGMEERWERAWSCAGRFISTLGADCVEATESVPSFFHALQGLHGMFPTAQRLADSDITPSTDITYSLAELQGALAFDGYQPLILCTNHTLISVVWPLHVLGTFQTGKWLPATTYLGISNCPSEGITYPASAVRLRPTVMSFDPIYRPTPRPVTLTNDPQRVYAYPEDGSGKAKIPTKMKKLGFFKHKDESRDREREDEKEVAKQWPRDEL